MYSAPFFALGQHLLSTLALAVCAGFAAVVLLIIGLAAGMDNTPANKRRGARLIAAAVICLLVAVFSPLIAQTFHLP